MANIKDKNQIGQQTDMVQLVSQKWVEAKIAYEDKYIYISSH